MLICRSRKLVGEVAMEGYYLWGGGDFFLRFCITARLTLVPGLGFESLPGTMDWP